MYPSLESYNYFYIRKRNAINVSDMKRKNVWQIFMDETSGVANAWIEMSKEIKINGVLDEKTMTLIKIGIFSVTRDPVALRHFVSEAFKAGISKEEIQAAALLAWNTGVTYSELALPLIRDVEENL